MIFNWIKEINRLIKEIDRLLRKGMSNIYLKVTIEKNFGLLSLKNLSPGRFLGVLTHADINEF